MGPVVRQKEPATVRTTILTARMKVFLEDHCNKAISEDSPISANLLLISTLVIMNFRFIFPLLFISLLMLISCKSSIDKDINWDIQIQNTGNSKLLEFSIDTLYLDSISSSFNGTLHTWNNKIVFVDHKFCWYYIFDTAGRFVAQKIGQGEKQNELSCKKISNYIPLMNGGHLFMGPSWDIYTFDSNFVKTSDYLIKWHPRGNKEFIAENPDPSDPIMYSITYGIQDIRADDQNIYLPIYSQHKTFFPAADAYAKESRVMGKLNIKTGDVTDIYGRLSPIYRTKPGARIFPYIIYDLIGKDEMVIGYPVDS
eukprot:TRINITY_DN7717_c0_g1_i1.p1 TRINITY_DN7717_c0_g1~~TRINITY_DN7717_c0_g1_i1.p1  ORF type:complete len:311 (+),score=-45.15 TRINITY_DN7717_c0_g1_i1:1-933(+)